MERFTRRENVLLGYSPQRSFENPRSSSEAALTNSDVDFDDVFGGPPRRVSLHERRYRNNSEETALSCSSLSGLSEKPVFGEESVNRRRYPSDDFFYDIFRGEDSHGSPRRSDRDPSCSTPASRVLSPARPLTPRAEPFATSLPPQFSLPVKVDAPTFASSSPYSTNASLSIFTSQAVRGLDELRNDVRSSYRQSPLSHEFSLRSKESTYVTKSDETNVVGNFKEDLKGGDVPSSPGQFHFSIYKWAGIGVPLVMPLRRRSTPKGKDKIERSSSYSGRVDSDLSMAKVHDADSLFLNHGTSTSTESFKMESEKKDNSSTHSIVEIPQKVEEAVIKKKESESLNTSQSSITNVSGGSMLRNKREETKPCTKPDIGISEGTEKIISMVTLETHKPDSKPLHSLLHGVIEGQGDEGKGNVVQMEKASHANVSAGKNVKNLKGKRTNSNRPEENVAGLQSTPIINSGEKLTRNGAKGKVKEFVGIFNQETSSKPKITVDSSSQSSKWKGTISSEADYEESVSTRKVDKKMHLPNLTKTQDASVLVGENVEQSEKQHSHIKASMHTSSDHSSGHKDASSFSESHPHGSKITIENLDDLLQEDFGIEELPHDQEKPPETSEEYDAIRVLDAKIQQWSNGKKGNIRSLLSTLQFVLWPGSGWKPVPLVDVIEGSAVKKAYQKALLCLHPDKLQQKGAASDKKYIAEKVFDILQEAWAHFNSMGSL